MSIEASGPADGRRRAFRRRPWWQRHSKGLLGAGLAVIAAAGAISVVLYRGQSRATPRSAGARPQGPYQKADRLDVLRATVVGSVPSPRQQAPAVRYGSSLAMLGGLAIGERPVASVVSIDPPRQRIIGHLPGSVSSTGAAVIGSIAYVVGGSNRGTISDAIMAFNLRSLRAHTAGHLKSPTTDAGVTSIHGVIYVVGGFTGKRWLRSVVAWRPGGTSRLIARLPVAVRFPAVAAVGARLIVVGGSNPNGVASRTIYAVDLRRGAVRNLGKLPTPLTHAVAVAFDSAVYVIGGRGVDPRDASSRIFAIDPRNGRIAIAGSLPRPVRDASAVVIGKRIMVAGGVYARSLNASVISLRKR